MSIKSLIQILIVLLILLILSLVYYNYFDTNKSKFEEINLNDNNNSNQIEELENKISKLEKDNKILNLKLSEKKNDISQTSSENLDIKFDSNFSQVQTKEESQDISNENVSKKKIIPIPKKDIKNLVKDVEYTSIDKKGNKFHLLANSAKSNANNSDILDLINVRGKITSDFRDTIYIVSDFAEYNSINLNSKFYENVIIDYQDKKITCINFDINMNTNKAVAYNNVIITDPTSIMKAGIVEFDLKTKDININPENVTSDVEVITN